MSKRKLSGTVLTLTVVAMAVLTLATPSARAASMSASLTAPTIDSEDIANYGTVTGTDKWWNDAAVSGRPKGQTFTTGATEVLLKAHTYQVTSTQKAEPTKTYVIRVGTISGTTFTEIHSETATQNFTWNASEYMTWTFDTPILLSPNTTYGIDVGMRTSTSGWPTGIPYINRTGDEYAGGTRYMSGETGLGLGDTTMNNTSGDMIFHLDLEHPLSPSPVNGATVPAGNVDLSWTNLDPNVGNDVFVDVWFGTNPGSLTQVVTAGTNTTSVTVSAPVADTYYWRVDSYLEGSATGSPLQSSVFTFNVIDTDGDGLPDDFELAHTDPPSGTALNPGDDLENGGAGDGLTNMQEFELGTDPNNADSDGDGLEDGAELTGVGLRPATDPADADTDGDGLNDGVETNTGTYVSTTDTGTDPTNLDSDGDGYGDEVETNTGTFIDDTNTGTDPTDADSDNDGAGDWYEITAAFTDPTDPDDKPLFPYPLPDPDATPPDASKPVKVFILSGQSNMVGFGRVNGSEPGTLETMVKQENKFPNLVDGGGDWITRNDVKYRGVISAIGNGLLAPGFGANGSSFGPELGFGQVMGYYLVEPVLLIKTSIGNRSLGWDCLPPGSPQYTIGGTTYAGYGDSPGSWPEGTPPEPINWYAGKQYDDYFLNEADHAPAGGDSIFNVTDILDNFATEYPEYAAQGFEIAGFVWWQGHKDQGEPYASRYESNMVNFINKLRAYYENRYPGKITPNAPFVLATIAFGGWDLSGAGLTVAEGQLAVGNPSQHPEFDGNVATIEARSYWRDAGPSGQDFHYYHNAETYMLVGDALGRAMVPLLEGSTPTPQIVASSVFAIAGEDFSLTAPTGGTGYQWSKLGEGDIGAATDDPALAFLPVEEDDAGMYSVTYDDGTPGKVAVTASYFLIVYPAGTTLPLAGLAGLSLLAGACTLGGTWILRRKH